MEDQIRLAAFNWLKEKTHLYGDTLSYDLLKKGFHFNGERITLLGPKGIWKPKRFKIKPISITSVYNGPYEDQISEDGLFIYKYRGNDPNLVDNVGLREIYKTKTPLILFFGVEKSRYLPIWPVYIVKDNPENLSCLVAVDPQFVLRVKEEDFVSFDFDLEPNNSIRKYVMLYTKHRLHQSSFREKVIHAYNCSCTLCRLRHRVLLDAAHIIPDSEKGGDPIVKNGLSLCKIHHAAYDSNIIGITPDYKIIVRKDILQEVDGPMLKYGLQELHNKKILLPRKIENRPDRDRLYIRFNRFRNAL